MIKAIIFDFDGVIIESAETKTKTFRRLFERSYPEEVAAIVNYHMQNAGISRYVKFRHIYTNILKQPLSETQEDELGKRFSEIALDEILNAPFVLGVKEFFLKNQKKYYMFIASGTPEEELKSILDHRRIDHLFKEVHGSPKQKHEIIQDIMDRYALSRKEIVFIGDAESDRCASEKAGINFIARITSQNGQELQNSLWRMGDFSELDGILEDIRNDYAAR